MTFNEEQVEWIVAEVIRRLRRMNGTNNQTASSVTEEVRIPDRVVTLRSLDGRLKGIKRVWVRQRAVVTPAAKDELKTQKIELVFEGKEH
jgi:hypothetical protein